jgi:hypothetical protein
MKKILIATAAVATMLTLAACDSTSAGSAVNADKAKTDTQLSRYQKNQPIPQSDYSQLRQTVIDAEMAQIHGVATTTFFFNQGTPNPVESCPSIGFPVPSTAQLTNPQQLVGNGGSSGYYGVGTIAQQEPNGVYTGDSAGTYVICVAPNGTKYINYAEEYAHTVGGAAHWDKTQGMIVLDGAPTVVAKSSK